MLFYYFSHAFPLEWGDSFFIWKLDLEKFLESSFILFFLKRKQNKKEKS